MFNTFDLYCLFLFATYRIMIDYVEFLQEVPEEYPELGTYIDNTTLYQYQYF